MTSWSDTKYYNWNVTSQLNSDMRLRVSGSNTRAANRGSIANNLQPDGSFFADGTSTNGFNTATWDADPEKFNDRWVRTGGNGRNDLYAANLDWVLTPKFFVNIQSGYYAYDSSTPSEFAGTQLIHSFSQSNTCTGAAGGSTCPFPEIPASLQQISGYADNKSTSRTLQDLYDRAYVNANTTWYKSLKGEHQFKFGARFERLGNKADLGAQLPTVALSWNRALTTSDGRTVRGRYGLLHGRPKLHARKRFIQQLEPLGSGLVDHQEQPDDQRRHPDRERARALVSREQSPASSTGSATSWPRASASPTTSRVTAAGRRTQLRSVPRHHQARNAARLVRRGPLDHLLLHARHLQLAEHQL